MTYGGVTKEEVVLPEFRGQQDGKTAFQFSCEDSEKGWDRASRYAIQAAEKGTVHVQQKQEGKWRPIMVVFSPEPQ